MPAATPPAREQRLLRPAERRDDVGDVGRVRPPRARHDELHRPAPVRVISGCPASSTPSITAGGKYSRNRVVAFDVYVTTRWRVSPSSWRSWWALPLPVGVVTSSRPTRQSSSNASRRKSPTWPVQVTHVGAVGAVLGRVPAEVVDLLGPRRVDVEPPGALGVVDDRAVEHAEALAGQPLHPGVGDVDHRVGQRLLDGVDERELEPRREHPVAALGRLATAERQVAGIGGAEHPVVHAEQVEVGLIDGRADPHGAHLRLRHGDGQRARRLVPQRRLEATDRRDGGGRRSPPP